MSYNGPSNTASNHKPGGYTPAKPAENTGPTPQVVNRPGSPYVK